MKAVLMLAAALLLSPLVMAQEYLLEAPDRAHSRQRIEVSWTAPQPDGALLEVRAVADGARRITYAYVRGNPQAIEVPEQPGDYELVFVYEREVRARHPLTVFLPEASVSGPGQAGAGEQFSVRWSGPVSRQDQITLAERGGAVIRGLSYTYVGNSRDGTVNLMAPADAGEYDIVYRSGSNILARSPLTVASVSASLEVPAEVHAGGEVRVRWDGPRNSQDRITFAEPGADPLRGASYRYVGNADDNVVVLTAREQTGPIDVVYVSTNRVIGRASLAIVPARMAIESPAEVTALGAFDIRWDGLANSGDQLFMLDEEDNRLTYRYVDPAEPVSRMTAPVLEGGHQLVYVSREGRELARRPIRVVPAPVEPGVLTVIPAQRGPGPEDAVAVIFDASGSMLQRLDGERRVEIARSTLIDLVSETLPAGSGFALRVFGHREPGACRTDLEAPLAPLDPARIRATIAGIEAMNLARTPLARSIELIATDLEGVRGQRIVVLLTDGEETCEGDPAAAITALRERGWDVRVNIVGFAIEDVALQQAFSAWAGLGGGTYFNAADRDELGAALVDAVAAEYEIVDSAGDVVARSSEDAMFTLPAGEYRVVWGGGEVSVSLPAGGAVTATM